MSYPAFSDVQGSVLVVSVVVDGGVVLGGRCCQHSSPQGSENFSQLPICQTARKTDNHDSLTAGGTMYYNAVKTGSPINK